MTPELFRQRLASGQLPRLLDIRTPYERDSFSPGGLHLPLDELLLRIDEIPADWKENEVIVYCGTGLQSGIAARILAKRGFIGVDHLEGGIEAYLSL